LLVIIAVLLVANLLVSLSRPATAEAKREYKVMSYEVLMGHTKINPAGLPQLNLTQALTAMSSEGWYLHSTMTAYGQTLIVFYR
jgi:hypothetical protein